MSLNYYKAAPLIYLNDILASFVPWDSSFIDYITLSYVFNCCGHNNPSRDFNRQNEAEVPGYCPYNIDIRNQRPKIDQSQVVS